MNVSTADGQSNDATVRLGRLNQQATWAVGCYTAYGQATSTLGALATWGVLGGGLATA